MRLILLAALAALTACGGGNAPTEPVEIAAYFCEYRGGIATSSLEVRCLNADCSERVSVLRGTCGDGTPFEV